jgi:acid phosphatase type 7
MHFHRIAKRTGKKGGNEGGIERNPEKGLTTLFVLGFLFLVALAWVTASADSGFEILPYVQNVEGTSVTISWKADGQETGRVEYGITRSYSALADGRLEHVVENGNPNPQKGSIVRARLTGLLPGKVYHYRVLLTSSASGDRIFRTPPEDANTPLTFLVYGDSRSDPEAHARVVSAGAANSDPAFVLMTGDLVPSSGASRSAWTSEFFEPADLLLKKTLYRITQGNHDTENGPFYLYFEMPQSGYGADYYSFDWGPVHVVTINTNKDCRPGSEQYEFLKRDLAEATRPFKIFFGHHPVYSSALHGSTKKIRRVLQPLFEANGVRLVFAGHDHSYERTIVNNVSYIVSGGGGASLHAKKQSREVPESLVFRKAYHFVEVGATADAMTVTAWVVDHRGVASMADHAVIEPLDQRPQERQDSKMTLLDRYNLLKQRQ